VVTENRQGLLVKVPVTPAADRAYDTRHFVSQLRELNVTPHVAQKASGRCSVVDGRTVRHEGYGLSQRARKRVEEFAFHGVTARQRAEAGTVCCCTTAW